MGKAGCLLTPNLPHGEELLQNGKGGLMIQTRAKELLQHEKGVFLDFLVPFDMIALQSPLSLFAHFAHHPLS